MILLHRLLANGFKQLQDIHLRFPTSGSLLIEGSNEAGKSSLFEAVFFALYGDPLIDDRDYRLEHLRGYGVPELHVELDFSIDGRPFSITRRLGQKHTARLRCTGADGEEQVLTRLVGIQDRVRLDLGLSREALLNSCFVEQKRLERLEELDPEKRHACVNELLNLRALTLLERENRVDGKEQAELRRLEQRVKIAEMDDQMPQLRREEQICLQSLVFSRMLEAESLLRQVRTEEADERRREIEIGQQLRRLWELESGRQQSLQEEYDRRHREWQAALATLHDRGTRRTRLERLKALADQAGIFQQLQRDSNDARRAVEQAEDLARSLPQAQAELIRLEKLRDSIQRGEASQQRLDRIAGEEADLRARMATAEARQRRANSRQEAIDESERELARRRQEYEAAAELRAGAELREALSLWIEAAERLIAIESLQARRSEIQFGQQSAARRLAEAQDLSRRASRQRFLAAGIAVLSLLASIAAYLAVGTGGLWLLALLVVSAVILARSVPVGAAAQLQWSSARSDTDSLAGELRQLETLIREAPAQTETWTQRRDAAVRRLGAVPLSLAAAREHLDRLPRLELPEARQVSENALGALQAAGTRLQLARGPQDQEDADPGDDPAALQLRLQDLLTERAAARERQIAAAAALAEVRALALAPSGLTEAIELARRAAAHAANAQEKCPPLRSAAADRLQLVEQQEERMARTGQELAIPSAATAELVAAAISEAGALERETLSVPDCILQEAEEQTRAQRETSAAALLELSALQAERKRVLGSLHPDLVRAELASQSSGDLDLEEIARAWAELQQQVEETEKRLHTIQHSLSQADERLQAQQLELASALGLENLPERSELFARFPELARAPGVAEAQLRWEAARDRQQDCQRARSLLAAQAGIGSDPLLLAAEQVNLGSARRQIRIKETSREIVRRTRDSIVSQVMPLTIRNMERLLPLLTEGRYHEARWDETTNSLSVYDSRAQSYQRKRVFSGGARDQISLALRLAFALATLPGEHQRRPGFLFLDEPLSSFDRSRTRALVDLLTHGLLRQQFQQIVLISHSESFDPDQFDYRLRMDAGRILDTNLPTL